MFNPSCCGQCRWNAQYEADWLRLVSFHIISVNDVTPLVHALNYIQCYTLWIILYYLHGFIEYSWSLLHRACTLNPHWPLLHPLNSFSFSAPPFALSCPPPSLPYTSKISLLSQNRWEHVFVQSNQSGITLLASCAAKWKSKWKALRGSPQICTRPVFL